MSWIPAQTWQDISSEASWCTCNHMLYYSLRVGSHDTLSCRVLTCITIKMTRWEMGDLCAVIIFSDERRKQGAWERLTSTWYVRMYYTVISYWLLLCSVEMSSLPHMLVLGTLLISSLLNVSTHLWVVCVYVPLSVSCGVSSDQWLCTYRQLVQRKTWSSGSPSLMYIWQLLSEYTLVHDR